MAIPPKCRIFTVIATLSFSFPAYAQAEGIITGLLKIYAFSLVVAFVVLILMLLGKQTRKVLFFPILLAVLPSLPLGKFLLQGGGTNSVFAFAVIGGYIAPWIFVVASMIAALVSKGRKAVPKQHPASERGRSLWLALNVTLPLAALLLELTRPLGFSIAQLLGHFAWFISLWRSLDKFGISVLLWTLNYLFVAIVLLKIFDWLAVWRWLKPASSGANILAVANVIVLAFFLAPFGDQSDPKFWAIRELTSLYVWVSMLLALIGYLVMIKSSFSGSRYNSPLNTDSPPTGGAPVS
jgi:hypothetical protein